MADKAGVELRMKRWPMALGHDRKNHARIAFSHARLRPGIWKLTLSDGTRIKARILIDGTELGDVAAALGVAELQDRITAQDMTYVAIVKEYDHLVTPVKPEGYDPELYRNCCDNPLCQCLG